MSYPVNFEYYIFNCLARYNRLLRAYREDALQEIRYAILVSENETEAIRLAQSFCQKMLMGFGRRRGDVLKKHEEYCRSLGTNEPEPDNALERIRQLYNAGHTAKSICTILGRPYNRAVKGLMAVVFN